MACPDPNRTANCTADSQVVSRPRGRLGPKTQIRIPLRPLGAVWVWGARAFLRGTYSGQIDVFCISHVGSNLKFLFCAFCFGHTFLRPPRGHLRQSGDLDLIKGYQHNKQAQGTRIALVVRKALALSKKITKKQATRARAGTSPPRGLYGPHSPVPI